MHWVASSDNDQSDLKDTVRSFDMFSVKSKFTQKYFLYYGNIYIHLIAYKILYLTEYFVFKRSLAICHITGDIFSKCPLIRGSISKTASIAWNILGSTY